jgi:hypothetical protein
LTIPKNDGCAAEYVPHSIEIEEARAARRAIKALFRHGDTSRLDPVGAAKCRARLRIPRRPELTRSRGPPNASEDGANQVNTLFKHANYSFRVDEFVNQIGPFGGVSHIVTLTC